jgi:5-methylcytosine-specific restriction endonuclease McrA
MQEVIREVLECAGKERTATTEVIQKILIVMEEKLYLEEGYPSLFSFLTKGAKYSEGAAMRRIQAARVVKQEPSVLGKLTTGELSLCSVAELGKVLNEENAATFIEKACNKSKREVEKLVAVSLPPKAILKRESIRPVAVLPPPVSPLFEESPPPREVKLLHEVRFHCDEELKDLLVEARMYLGQRPIGEILKLGLKALVKEKKPKSAVVREYDEEGRRIPKHLRQEVLLQAGFQCEFTTPNGVRCCEATGLQIDHVTPFALGGKSKLSNLRVLCGPHNRFEAEREFGVVRNHRHQGK